MCVTERRKSQLVLLLSTVQVQSAEATTGHSARRQWLPRPESVWTLVVWGFQGESWLESFRAADEAVS